MCHLGSAIVLQKGVKKRLFVTQSSLSSDPLKDTIVKHFL